MTREPLSDIDLPAAVRRVDGIELDDTRSDGFMLRWTDEASIRRGLARLARAYGWAVVREEVVVPGWGRIDLHLQEYVSSESWLVELKLDLTRASAARKAFQQVDGYGRWWVKEHGVRASSLVVAARLDRDVMKAVGDVYPASTWCGLSTLMGVLRKTPTARVERLNVARDRLSRLEREAALHRRAVLNLEEDLAEVDSGVGF